MADIRLIGEIHDRRLYLAQLARLEDWPAQLEEPARPFVVFTAFDATRLTDDELLTFARLLLEQGCVYACSWGPEALRFENAFDEAVVTAELAGRPYVDEDEVVMTTSDDEESLDDALWFAVFTAYPAYGEVTGVLAISEQTGPARSSLAWATPNSGTHVCWKRKRKAAHDVACRWRGALMSDA